MEQDFYITHDGEEFMLIAYYNETSHSSYVNVYDENDEHVGEIDNVVIYINGYLDIDEDAIHQWLIDNL